jgi:hypothetical protein
VCQGWVCHGVGAGGKGRQPAHKLGHTSTADTHAGGQQTHWYVWLRVGWGGGGGGVEGQVGRGQGVVESWGSGSLPTNWATPALQILMLEDNKLTGECVLGRGALC